VATNNFKIQCHGTIFTNFLHIYTSGENSIHHCFKLRCLQTFTVFMFEPTFLHKMRLVIKNSDIISEAEPKNCEEHGTWFAAVMHGILFYTSPHRLMLCRLTEFCFTLHWFSFKVPFSVTNSANFDAQISNLTSNHWTRPICMQRKIRKWRNDKSTPFICCTCIARPRAR
jgi:hypothetical protein